MTTGPATMTREEAIEKAREHWGEGEPHWKLDTDAATLGTAFRISPMAFQTLPAGTSHFGMPTRA